MLKEFARDLKVVCHVYDNYISKRESYLAGCQFSI